MAELTTPNKPRRPCLVSASSTEGDSNSQIALSPFLSLSSPYYLSRSTFSTVNIVYVSPMRASRSHPQLEDVLISICEKLNHELATTPEASQPPLLLQKGLKKPVTPLRRTETESTSEGSDVKSAKTESRVRVPEIHERSKLAQQPEEKQLDKVAVSRLDNKRISVEERVIRKRKRKSMEQLKLLAEEYRINPCWNKSTMSTVARKTGLSEAQVYKWGWDQKKKKLDDSTSSSVANLYS